MSDADLDFALGGVRYQVPIGDVVDIPDRYAYAVPLQGIRLVPASDVESGGGRGSTPKAPDVAPQSVAEPSKLDVSASKKGKR